MRIESALVVRRVKVRVLIGWLVESVLIMVWG
jgi:hypothetical protein